MQRDKNFSFFQYKKKSNLLAKTGKLGFDIYWGLSKMVGAVGIGVCVMGYSAGAVDDFLHKEQREQKWEEEIKKEKIIDAKVDAISTAFNQKLSSQLVDSASQDSVIASLDKNVEINLATDNTIDFRFVYEKRGNSFSYKGSYLIDFTNKKFKSIYLSRPSDIVLKDFMDNDKIKVEEMPKNSRSYTKTYKITKK